jgi:Uma2 family endonuclease
MEPSPAPDATVQSLVYTWLTERHWSEAEYLMLANDRNLLVELSDGKVVVHAMPTPRHQAVVLNLAFLLRQTGQGRVFVAPMPVRLWPGKMREPDVMWYDERHLDRIQDQFAGPPDLAIEVLSPSSRSVDLGVRLQEYAEAGIPEYWVVELDAENVSVYTLSGADYELVVRYRNDEQIQSASVPALSLAAAEVFAA